MERKSNPHIGEESILRSEKVRLTAIESATSGNGNKTKDSSCQTEIEEIVEKQQPEFEDLMEHEGQQMEKGFIEQKEGLEVRLRNDYNEVLKAKDEVIRVLTEEKDFFRNELRDVRKSFDLFTKHVHRDAFKQLGREGERKLGTTFLQEDNDSRYYHDNDVGDNGELLSVLRKQEEILLGSFEREKAAMILTFEREKTALRAGVEEECEEKYAFERAYLLQSIEGLKEGLDCLKIQKNELAKIFEGEKNALEVSFKRKEDELRQNLKLEHQRELIKAQKPWARTKI